ncbi:MAG: DUF445 domain-containing protein [Gammaproteobacteria bacterium]
MTSHTDSLALELADDAAKRRGLRNMQLVALALLAGATLLFAVAHVMGGAHPAWGYVKAFAEAAMIGAVADWFAVVALFRHPLGIPIWHTAIIPNNKEAIGRNLGSFVENHLVTEDAVTRRVADADLALYLGQWLAQPEQAGQLAGALAGALRQAVPKLDKAPIRAAVRKLVTTELKKLDLSLLAGDYLDTMLAANKQQQVLDALLGKLGLWLGDEGNHEAIGTFMLDCFAIDNPMIKGMLLSYAPKVIAGLHGQVNRIQEDPAHPLRARVGEWIADSAARLKDDPSWRADIDGVRDRAVDSGAVQSAIDGLVDTAEQRLLQDLDSGQSQLAGLVARVLAELGQGLAADPDARRWLNLAIQNASSALVRRYRGEIGRFIEAQLAGWSREEMTNRIELAVGRDLQFIRINGTLVGGLVGLLIYTVTTLL